MKHIRHYTIKFKWHNRASYPPCLKYNYYILKERNLHPKEITAQSKQRIRTIEALQLLKVPMKIVVVNPITRTYPPPRRDSEKESQ